MKGCWSGVSYWSSDAEGHLKGQGQWSPMVTRSMVTRSGVIGNVSLRVSFKVKDLCHVSKKSTATSHLCAMAHFSKVTEGHLKGPGSLGQGSRGQGSLGQGSLEQGHLVNGNLKCQSEVKKVNGHFQGQICQVSKKKSTATARLIIV